MSIALIKCQRAAARILFFVVVETNLTSDGQSVGLVRLLDHPSDLLRGDEEVGHLLLRQIAQSRYDALRYDEDIWGLVIAL